jgi:glycosyltransferase involved in cell wall biosynthesis
MIGSMAVDNRIDALCKGGVRGVDDRKKVLLCSLSMTLGGVEMRMGLEARLLRKIGIDARIAVNMHNGLDGWADSLQKEGIPVYDFDPPPFMEQWWWNRRRTHFKNGIFGRHPYTLWRIARIGNKAHSIVYTRRFLKRFRPHLIHVFVPWTIFEGTRLWVAHHFGIPTIMSIRNSFDDTAWRPWEARHYREAFQSVKGVYAISASALAHFMKIYDSFLQPATHVEIIHNSIDEKKFTNSQEKRVNARKNLDLPENALVIGYVGRLEKQKRPLELLKIFENVSRIFPAAYLAIVGTGPLQSELQEFAGRHNLKNRVIFSGWQQNVEDFIPAFDIALTVSRNEGFGTTTIEAMACGIPVVGTDITGTRDILHDSEGGILVPLGDRQAAVDACKKLLSSRPVRTKMGQAARQEAVRRFSEKEWEGKIVRFYEKILQN